MKTFTFHRAKLLVIAITCMFTGLAILEFCFSAPPGVRSSQSNSFVVLKNIYSGINNSYFRNTSKIRIDTNNHKLKEIVYDASEENYVLPKNANLKR